MNTFDAILSTEVLAGVLVIASLAMSVRSVLIYTREATEIRPKLNKLDRELQLMRDGMVDKKKKVNELTKVVAPLKAVEERLRPYYEELKEIELEEEKNSMARSEEEEAAKKRRVQRQKMGFTPGEE